jgi:sodium-dependent dicarboxylate transporter 2/3/5
MAVWWVSEAIPIGITALIPVVLFPALGVLNGKAISSAYFNHVIFLFIGGFLMALAMEKHNLHKRIALKILSITGSSYGRILFGFMLATWFLSMWMSNTTTAMMMVPIAISVITKFEENTSGANAKKYSYGFLFGIAYSASIGGIATLIGTPPNLSFARIFNIIFKNGPEIIFSQWIIFALPISILMFLAAWLLLYLKYKPKGEKKDKANLFSQHYVQLGRITYEEKIILATFVTLALLWIFRSDIKVNNFVLPGWSNLFSQPKFLNDGTVAMAISLLLFMIPSKAKKGENILEGRIILRLPWHIVLLFGGGFALAQGFAESGLALWLGERMSAISALPPFLIILVIAMFMSFLTELTSNTATTEMLLPILAGIGVSININPLMLMIPATLAASLAFMLPVATPPNAIVFGTNQLKIAEMMKTGFLLNVIGVLIITLIMYYWGQIVFDIDLSVFPDWAVK